MLCGAGGLGAVIVSWARLEDTRAHPMMRMCAHAQQTLYDMGSGALVAAPELAEITLTAPNIHFIPAPALAATKLGVFEHDVYLPTSEPSGVITCTLRRSQSARL